MTDHETCNQCGGLEPCGIRQCAQLRDTIADRDSWRIRSEAAEALVRQMRVEMDAEISRAAEIEAESAFLKDKYVAETAAVAKLHQSRDAAIAAKEAAERERDRAHSVYQSTANAIIAFCYRRSTMLGTSEVEAAVKSLAIAMQDAESREHELGIQYRAAQERLRLAGACVETLRDIGEQDCPYRDNCPIFGSNHGVCDGCRARRALAAYDAVPGDAKVSP